MQIIKNAFLFFFLGVFVIGCSRSDTNSQSVFYQVKNEVADLTGEKLYWDSCLEDKIVPISVKQMIKKRLTEDSIVKVALLNNRNLQAVYESLGIAKAQLAQAGKLTNPIFSFSYRFSTEPSISDLIDGSFIQNFLEMLLIPLKSKMARAELDATKKMVVAQVLDVIAKTKIAFYNLQATKQEWNLKKQILLATELSYEAAQRLFEAGNITDLEVSKKHFIYEQSKLDVATLEVVILEQREKLNVLMGLYGRQIDWKFSSHLPPIPPKEEKFKNIENDAIASSIDLQVLYKELVGVAAGLGIDTTRLILPQINAGISTEREGGDWYVGPAFGFAIPLFDSGQIDSVKAKSRILQKWNQYTALAIEIRSQARLSRVSLLNAFRQSQYLEKVVVPLAEQITAFTLLQHNAMQLSVFCLLQAKEVEIEKKIQQVQKKKDYWVSKIKLQTLLKGHVLKEKTFEFQESQCYE